MKTNTARTEKQPTPRDFCRSLPASTPWWKCPYCRDVFSWNQNRNDQPAVPMRHTTSGDGSADDRRWLWLLFVVLLTLMLFAYGYLTRSTF